MLPDPGVRFLGVFMLRNLSSSVVRMRTSFCMYIFMSPKVSMHHDNKPALKIG